MPGAFGGQKKALASPETGIKSFKLQCVFWELNMDHEKLMFSTTEPSRQLPSSAISTKVIQSLNFIYVLIIGDEGP